jgi:hypothetical protein
MLKSDLLHIEMVEKYIVTVQSAQDLLISFSVDGHLDMADTTLDNLYQLGKLKSNLVDLKENLSGKCVVWREPEKENAGS